MFKKDNKQRLYWLLDMYYKSEINESTFCDEFYESYNLEVNDDDLNELEKMFFSELDNVASRFSEFEEDFSLDPKAFSTSEELRKKILYVRRKLVENDNP